MKNKDIKLKNLKYNEDETLELKIYRFRLDRLESCLKENKLEIKRLNKESTEEQIRRVDAHFNANLKDLGDLKEMQRDVKDLMVPIYLSRLENLYNENQNEYLNRKITLIDEKLENVNEEINKSIDKVKENTNNITGNILFSLISIVLGISLVSAMTSAIKDMDSKYYLPYYVTIAWLAIIVIGFSYLLLRNYDKKSLLILGVIAFVTVVLILIFYISFFKLA